MKRIDLETLAATLGATTLLAKLPRRELDELAHVGRQSTYAAGDAVFRKAMPGTFVFLLVSGRVKITTTGPTGTDLILSLVEPGELFGEIAAVDGGPRTVNAVVTRESLVVAFDRRFIMPILSRNPETSHDLSEALCGHLRTAVANLEKVGLLDSQTRLWTRLMDLAARYSSDTPSQTGALRIDHGLSQQSLAESVGLTRVIVNRVLNRWREAGLVELGRGFVVIRDVDALEKAVAERDPAADHLAERVEAGVAAE